MTTGLRFAAIDIGSNAVRLLLAGVFEADSEPFFKKISLIRMPIRLGEDSFVKNQISDDKIEKLIQSMIGFKHLIAAYQPISFRACATSAMREAKNHGAICKRVLDESGIDIQVISGQEEADIIFSNGSRPFGNYDNAQVYVDVGGGSTEVTVFHNGDQVSRSFNIGTIRVMQDMVTSADWDEMKMWVRDQTAQLKNITAIGSGGNIHKILRLAKSKDGPCISRKQMKKVRKLLKAHTVAERIVKLGLKPDRADVILPAHKIYHSILKWGKIPYIKVPQMGLADGIVRRLYFQYHTKQ